MIMPPKELRRLSALFLLTLGISLAVLPEIANAELKLCNTSSSKVGVAIGYRDKDGWASEGWWNVDRQSCTILLQGKLTARFYYVYAVDYDKGGEWGGPITMCTNDKEFTIHGIDSCEGRGFKKSGFFEVDTLNEYEWTVKLLDEADPSKTDMSAGNTDTKDKAALAGPDQNPPGKRTK